MVIYIDVILRYENEIAFWNRMAAINHPMRVNEDNSPVKVENHAFEVMTPTIEDINGDKFLRARMIPSDADKLPPNNNPAFTILWRSDINLPEPEIEITDYDEYDNVSGTRMQAVGGF